MPNELNLVPEFTTDEGVKGTVEVKEAVTEEVAEPEKEAPVIPPITEKPAVVESVQDTGKGELERATLGLQSEVLKLRQEITELRGQKRELKKEELFKAQEKLDELKDVNPEDTNLVERILRSKGYLTKQEVSEMHYKSVQDDELTKFLEKYPEYKPENDPSDGNWNALQRELAYYKMPENPRQVREVLDRAHKAIFKPSDRSLPEKKRQIEVASVGSGGTQRSSSSGKTLDPTLRKRLEDGGWSEEDIRRIESKK